MTTQTDPTQRGVGPTWAELLRGDEPEVMFKAWDPRDHPRDHEGRFTDGPADALRGLSGAWSEWAGKVSNLSAAEVAALGDPRIRVESDMGSTTVGGAEGHRDAVAARWKRDHVAISGPAWDNTDPDTREFMLAHEVSHAAAADVLANIEDRDELLRPFRNTETGSTYSTRALVFPGERDDMARGPEEMLSDVGAELLTRGRDVLAQRFENEKKFDIGAKPADERLQRLYAAVAASLDRVGNPAVDRMRKDYDPEQPRDHRGRWSRRVGGGGGDRDVAGPRQLTDAEFQEQYGQERPNGKGNCYEAAGEEMLRLHAEGEDMSQYRYCVGQAVGRGAIAGVIFDHAWVEKFADMDIPEDVRDAWEESGATPEAIAALANADVVIDKANGNDIETLKVVYYAMGGIQNESVRRYTFEEMYENVMKRRYWGIWD